jgi:hypothetical protein
MAANPVQAVLGSWVATGPGTTAPISPSLPVGGTNNPVVLLYTWASNSANTITSVTDNQSGNPNTYTKLIGLADSASQQSPLELWWCQSPTINLGTYTVTATFPVTTGQHILPRFFELSGISGADAQAAFSFAPLTTSPVTITAGSANSTASDFVLALLAFSSTGTDPAINAATVGYTSMPEDTGFGVAFEASRASYKTTSAIETSAATWAYNTAVGSTGICALIQTFSQSTAVVLPTIPPRGPLPKQIYILP